MRSDTLNIGLKKTDNSDLEFWVDGISTISYNILLPRVYASHRSHHMPNITYNSIVDKLPHNIIQCKAYGNPNAQNKTCEMLNGS